MQMVPLFSHSADFTLVCTTELGNIMIQEQQFKKRGASFKIKSHSDRIEASIFFSNANIRVGNWYLTCPEFDYEFQLLQILLLIFMFHL
jgi:hypothetical protein